MDVTSEYNEETEHNEQTEYNEHNEQTEHSGETEYNEETIVDDLLQLQTPNAILDAWIIQHNNTILQRSPEWYAARRLCIGGSSIATIMGLNPYESLIKFMRSKLSDHRWDGDIKTQWGTMFEPVITRHVEKIYNTTVKCDNYFVKNGPLAYSPDGIAVIDSKITLLEFKCPYTRIPTASPPKYYIPQVKMGLEMLPLCERGLFIEGVYRACPWHDMDNDTYVLIGSQRNLPRPRVYNRGFIGFTAKRREDDDMSTLIDKFVGLYGSMSTADDIHDLSDITEEVLELLIMSPHTEVYYSGDGDLHDELDMYQKHLSTINEDDINIYGILPWKLIHLQQTIIDRSPGFLEPWMDCINDIVGCIAEYTDPSNIRKKENILDAFLERRGYSFIE